MPIELGLTPDSRWNPDLGGLVDGAAGAGFRTVGITAAHAGGDVRPVFEAAHIGCHELLALWVTDDADKTLATANHLTNVIGLSAVPWVLTFFSGSLPRDVDALIARCAAMFADAGAKMAVEFTPFGQIDSIARGLEIVAAAGRDRAGHDRAGLLIDSWHFTFGPSTWDDLERVPIDQIAYVQFTDGLEPISDDIWNEAGDRRALPGEGMFELERFASVLRARGFDGVVSVEVLNSELCALPVAEAARRAYETSAPYWL